MGKGKERRKAQSMKVAAKKAQMQKPGHKSTYAKKHVFLTANGGWGFEYHEKPWK